MGKLFPQASGVPGQLVSARLVQLGNGIFCYHFREDEGTGRSRNLPQGSQLGSGRAGIGPEASRCEEHAHTPMAHHQTLVQGARGQGASVCTDFAALVSGAEADTFVSKAQGVSDQRKCTMAYGLGGGPARLSSH